MYTIIGHGCNDLEVPLVFFNKKENAENFLAKLGLKKMEEKEVISYPNWSPSTELRKLFPNGSGPYTSEESKAYKKIVAKFNKEIVYRSTGEFFYVLPEPLTKKIEKALLKDYYDGCGGVYSLKIREVEEGKPIVGWDLD